MLLSNRLPEYRAPLLPQDAALIDAHAAEAVRSLLAVCPSYRATPLRAMPAMASRLGIAALAVKDEGGRFGLGSFKALGGMHAVIRLVLETAEHRLGCTLEASALLAPEVRAVAKTMTFACATDGNHGRSVAAGARLVGGKAVIFVHQGVSPTRLQHLHQLGAQVVVVAGSYDESVLEAARCSAAEGWTEVSDTARAGYERIPGWVMQGYTTIAEEIVQAQPLPPTHVFLQAGVGGFAAAISGYMRPRFGTAAPITVVVEPARAACFFASREAGSATQLRPGLPTIMAMLECHTPSPIAWRMLARTADAFMTVDDEQAIAAMRALAAGQDGDPAIVAGESGAAGLAGLLEAAADPIMRAEIGLGAQSRVLVVNTEGATDPAIYDRLVSPVQRQEPQ